MSTCFTRREFAVIAALGVTGCTGSRQNNDSSESNDETAIENETSTRTLNESPTEERKTETIENTSGSIFSQEWKTFQQNASRTGVSKQNQGPSKEVQPRIKVDISGLSSSPVVTTDSIYYSYYSNSEGGTHLRSIDRESGETTWETETSVSTDPTVQGERVYVGTEAFDRNSGELIWKLDTATMNADGGPAVENDKVYIRTDVGIAAANAENGDIIWEFKGGESGNSGPAVGLTSIYYYDTNGITYSVDKQSGELNWSAGEPRSIDSGVPPATIGDSVYIPLERTLLSINADSGKINWSNGGGYISPCVSDGLVFASGGRSSYTALNRETGDLQWGGSLWVNGIVSDSKTLYISGDGKILAANPSDGSEIWSYDTGDGSVSTAAIADNEIYATLYNRDKREGELLVLSES